MIKPRSQFIFTSKPLAVTLPVIKEDGVQRNVRILKRLCINYPFIVKKKKKNQTNMACIQVNVSVAVKVMAFYYQQELIIIAHGTILAYFH